MTLSISSVEWAIQFIADHSDGDLFPRVTEMSAILARKPDLAKEIAGKPLTEFGTGAHRRFIVPKDDISYRQATQLDPQDTIILSAIAYQFGSGIEGRRPSDSTVFSYRFQPTPQHGLYSNQSSWNKFWKTASLKAQMAGCIVYTDISDFYNQISHHAVENQLIASGLPNQAVKWVISLLESTTAGVSRGVPIGPHAAHLIAEASLIPIDNSMATSGLDFIRYADDIIIFCASETDAKRALSRLATILDRQQRLILQRHKTKLFTPTEFTKYSNSMIEDRPINDEEDKILKLVVKYSGGDPYKTISYNEIGETDWEKITEPLIRKIISEYIGCPGVDYIRLRWFYRRLAQIGHPGAIDVTLENISALSPCFSSICAYFSSLQAISPEQWKVVGSRLLNLLDRDEVADSEYFRLSVLSLFSRSPHINHFKQLASKYRSSDPFAKREILLAACTSGADDWIREFKEDFDGMDPWQKRAFLYCCRKFPIDERKYFINRWKFERPFDVELAKWAKSSS